MSLSPAADTVLRILVLLARQVRTGARRDRGRRPRAAAVDHVPAARERWSSRASSSYLPEERRYGLGVVTFELGSAYSAADAAAAGGPAGAQPAGRPDQAERPSGRAARPRRLLRDRAAGAGRPTLVSDVGVRLPATVTASGLAILAALPAAQVRAIFPPGTPWWSAPVTGRPPSPTCAGAGRGPAARPRAGGGPGDRRSVLGEPARAGPHRPPGRGGGRSPSRGRGSTSRPGGRWSGRSVTPPRPSPHRLGG